MVEYASRMLAALEELSIQGTQYGNVAAHALRLRRNLATSLWCQQNGALNQLKGIGQSTTTNLKFHGITTFDDVLKSTEEAIEKAANRGAPFGANLRSAVSKIVNDSLKLAAHLEYASGSETPCSLVCRLRRRNMPRGAPVVSSSSSTPTVTYTLLAYTDFPVECLLYKKDLSTETTFKVDTPARFKRVRVELLASLVGLDGKPQLPLPQHVSLPLPLTQLFSMQTSLNCQGKTASSRCHGRKVQQMHRRSTEARVRDLSGTRARIPPSKRWTLRKFKPSRHEHRKPLFRSRHHQSFRQTSSNSPSLSNQETNVTARRAPCYRVQRLRR